MKLTCLTVFSPHARVYYSNLLLPVLLTSLAFGTTISTTPAGTGNLSYSIQSISSLTCHDNFGHLHTLTKTIYHNFSYTDPFGNSQSLSGTATLIEPSNIRGCPTTFSTAFSTTYAEIVFDPLLSTAKLTYTNSGVLYPQYQVLSIIYSAPGNRSSSGFTNSTTDGTTTSVGSSFQVGDTITFSVSGGFLGLGSTLSWTYGNSITTGNTTAVTSTITQATGISNASSPGGPNAINHHQDLFIIWLNPAILITQTGATTANYSVGTQLQTTGDPNPGSPEIQDQVEVFAESMMPNAQGATTVPLAILVPQVVDSQTLPGLAQICAHLISGYPASCTQANQCGCVPSDFAPILSQDPLLNFPTTDSPLNADASGSACSNPTPSDSCRYVPVVVAQGSSVQINELLAGPQQVGGNIPTNSFTQTDSTQKTQTFSESFSNTVAFSWERKLTPLGNGLSFRSMTQFTWTSSESSGQINGVANSMAVNLSSSTVGCNQDIPIFEDTVFHTFVFQQPAGNGSCP